MFAVVVETATLSEVELVEYCRGRGLYRQEVGAWRESCARANAMMCAKAERAEIRAHKQRIKTPEYELHRKDKVLAETAALLVFEKSPDIVRGAQGRIIDLEKRVAVSTLTEETCAAGAPQEKACPVIGIPCAPCSAGVTRRAARGRMPARRRPSSACPPTA